MFLNLMPLLHRRVVTYGIEAGAYVTAPRVQLSPAGAEFEVEVNGKTLGQFSIRVPGRHNVQNALAAIAVGLELDLNAAQIRDGFEHFRGADRRFQVKADNNGITLVDDYGHHPSEIRATLDAARLGTWKRIWAIFQPHRYTRTQFLMDDFASCFAGCDRVYVLDVYAASEQPIPGITSERLVDRMRELGFDRARYAPSEEAVISEVLQQAQPGDLIMTIGAGSITRMAETLAEAMRKRGMEGKIHGVAEETARPVSL
jgi:UDP-N-acetylmuramate--alanine ligase